MKPVYLDELERLILNSLQEGFPICERPFLAIASDLGLDEFQLIKHIGRLFDAGALSRFAPQFYSAYLGVTSVLAAMALPENDLENIAEFINVQPEIAYIAQCEQHFNLWFVGTAETLEKVESLFAYIESVSGYPVYRLPNEREFCVELKLKT